MTSYNFGTGLDTSGISLEPSEAYPDVSELIAAVSNIQANIDTVLGVGDISVVVSDVNTAKSNITIQTGRISVASNAIVTLNVRTSNLEGSYSSLNTTLNSVLVDINTIEDSLEDYATLSTTQVLRNKTLNYASNTFIGFPETDLTITTQSINDLDTRIDSLDTDLFNFDLRLDNDEVIINVNTNKILSNSNNISSNIQNINSNLQKINLNSNNIATVSNNLALETLRINTALLNDIALNLRIDEADDNIDALDTRLDTVEGAASTYVTLTGVQTISGKIFDFNTSTFNNFPIGGEGGATGDVTLNGTQTLTNKTMNFADNTFIGFETDFDDSAIQTTLTELDTRLDEAETDITSLSGFIITNSNNIVALSNAVDIRITNLPQFDDTDIQNDLTVISGRVDTVQIDITNLDNRLDTAEVNITNSSSTISTNTANILSNSNNIVANTSGISTLNTNYTSLSNNVVSLSNSLVGVSNNVVSNTASIVTNTANISTANTNIATNTTAISNRVIGPATNTANYIPQWNGVNSKTLKDGIDASTLVTLTGIQTISGKIFDYNTSTFNNFPSSGGGGTFTPSASNITVVNSNLPIDVTNISNLYKFRAYVSADYDNTSNPGFGVAGSFNTIRFDTENYDLNNNFNNTTFGYTVPVSGYYDIECTVKVNLQGGTGGAYDIQLMTSTGTILSAASTHQTVGAGESLKINDKLALTSGQIIVVKVKSPGTSGTYTYGNSYFAMALLNATTVTTIPIVTTTNINAYTYSGTGNIMTGQVNSNNYIPYWSSNNSTFLTNGIDLATIGTLTGTQTITNKTINGLSNTLTNISVINFINPYKFRAIPTANLTIATNVFTNLALGTASLDTNANYNTSTYIYTVPITGQYQVNVMARWSTSTDLQRCILKVMRGAVDVLFSDISGSGTVCNQNTIVDILPCTAGDQLKCQVYQLAPTTPGNRTLEVVGTSWSMFLVCL